MHLYFMYFRSDGNEVYLPFSFLEKHFEASLFIYCIIELTLWSQMKGEMVGDQEFEISESYGKVFTPR